MLSTVDLENYFLIGIFRSGKGSTCYQATITHVVKNGRAISVYVQMNEPGVLYQCGERETTPYHIVKVRRDQLLNEPSEDDTTLVPVHVTTTPPPEMLQTPQP